MADSKQLEILWQGVDAWNKWCEENPNANIDLMRADLREFNLSKVNLRGGNLYEADLGGANLIRADLSEVRLMRARLNGANLSEANLSKADLSEAHLLKSHLNGANLSNANLSKADLWRADLSETDLHGADLMDTDLKYADLHRADLGLANLGGANLRGANLCEVKLIGANLKGANLIEAKLVGADLSNSDFSEVNLSEANLSGANLKEVNLNGALLVGTLIDKARVTGSSVYAINVWDLKGEFEEQRDLIITRKGDPIITVDNIKIAQFIYLILNNEEIRDVINTLTSKSVLILGRFAIPERKAILDALRNSLREYNLVPIVFDFDRPIDRNITETIKTLAGISYFVIADVTSPKSSPLELHAIIPDYQIPIVPIIQEGELSFSMINDLRNQYNGLLDPLTYDSEETLIKVLKSAIIDPAIEKHNELRLIKARAPKIRSAKDFLDKIKE